MNCIISYIRNSIHVYDKNEMYLRFIDLFYTLFSSCIQQKDVRIIIKRHGQNRPFWNKELELLWGEVVKSEHLYLKIDHHSIHRQDARSNFIDKQHMFDKQYRYYKRKYESEKQTMIEQFRTTDPKQFWKALKNIGPKRAGPCHSIPWKVISSDGEITSNKNDVLNVWKNKFQLLYSAPVIPVNSVFINHIIDSLAVFDLMYSDDVIMDSPILLEEVERAIKSKKSNKSVSIDGLPYEIYTKYIFGTVHCMLI